MSILDFPGVPLPIFIELCVAKEKTWTSNFHFTVGEIVNSKSFGTSLNGLPIPLKSIKLTKTQYWHFDSSYLGFTSGQVLVPSNVTWILEVANTQFLSRTISPSVLLIGKSIQDIILMHPCCSTHQSLKSGWRSASELLNKKQKAFHKEE